MDASADIRNRAAQRVAAENHGADPKNPSKNVEGQVAGVRHLCRTGDGRAEGSNDGNEARENDGTAAIFFVEVVGALKMAAPEEERVFAAVESCTCRAANPVADLIAHDGASITGKRSPLRGMKPPAERMPAVTSRESPGRKKPTKKPVSIKTMAQMSGDPPAWINSLSPSGLKSAWKK